MSVSKRPSGEEEGYSHSSLAGVVSERSVDNDLGVLVREVALGSSLGLSLRGRGGPDRRARELRVSGQV